MKQIIQNEKLGEIVFEESFWTGKKSLTINGTQLEKTDKRQFKMQDGNFAIIDGNFFAGSTLVFGSESIMLTPKIKWYEILLAMIPFLLILVWGNCVPLCKIVPVVGGAIGGTIRGAVVGGAIGGAISGFLSCLGLYVIKSVKPIWQKLLVALAVVGITFGICYGIGDAILDAVLSR